MGWLLAVLGVVVLSLAAFFGYRKWRLRNYRPGRYDDFVGPQRGSGCIPSNSRLRPQEEKELEF